MIKAVIFDMFETLITHYNHPLYFGAHIAKDTGIEETEFLKLWRGTEDDRTLGIVTLEEVIESILKKKGCYTEEKFNYIIDKRKRTTEECFNHMHPQIVPMLSKLKENKILIGLISNCFSEETEAIYKSEIIKYFDAIFLSYEQGIKKPDREIFERCISKLNVAPEECLYVGDGGSDELESSRDLGMKSLRATWYLKDGRLPMSTENDKFEQINLPMQIVEKASKIKGCN